MTDFVGWLPMGLSDYEEVVAADMNHEMIRHVEELPEIRDAAIFVGDPEDVTPGSFGPGLPDMPSWVARHFDFCGYVTDAAAAAVRGAGEGPLIVATGGRERGRARVAAPRRGRVRASA